MFRAIISPILRNTRRVYSLWYNATTMLPVGKLDEVPPHPVYQQAA